MKASLWTMFKRSTVLVISIALVLLWRARRRTIPRTSRLQAPFPSCAAASCRRTQRPLKVFLMVGQSNMQGHGYIDTKDEQGQFRNGTLAWMVHTFPNLYGKLLSKKNHHEDTAASGNWTVRDDTWIAYNRQAHVGNVRPEINQHGPLIPGYGGEPGQQGTQMGPELGFGWTMAEALNGHDDDDHDDADRQQILLLKIAWGGRSLAVNFRPPSSGGETGLYYEAMIANTFRTLSRLDQLFCCYNASVGYELAGFVWHQGWNDGCNANMTAEYEFNLANLIRDIRIDLGVPDLPVSIGTSGFLGWNTSHNEDRTGSRAAIVAAQLAVANATKYPEFAGTVATAETRSFARPPLPASPGIQIYHWNNNCETYWLVGQAMGEAMLKLLSISGKRKSRRDIAQPQHESILAES